MAKRRRKAYSEEFKREAVRLTEEDDRTVSEIAESLGIHKNLLHKWRRHYLGKSTELDARPRHDSLEEENKRLRRELEEARKDLEILKKAAAYFAREQD